MKRTIYTIGFLLGISAFGYAQQGELVNVKVLDEEVKKNGREVNVRLTLDLTDVKVGGQESFHLYPAVVAKEGTKELLLAPVVVDGKTRSRVHRREKALTGASATDGAHTVLQRKSGKQQVVEYAATLPYEPWMAQSRLVLREQVTGCRECIHSSGEEAPVKDTFLRLFQPRYVTAFVQPDKETVKVRNEVRVARLQFRQNSYKIEPGYKNNGSELSTVSSSIELVKTNPDLSITGVYITGYASPEASASYNRTLSERRAEALAAYAQKDTEVDASLWHVTGAGEDWEGLREEVKKHPDFPQMDHIRKIIDACDGDKDRCEKRIRDAVSPEVYQRILKEVYAPLRRNEYRIEYNVKNFTLEEAEKLLKTRPDLLSVEEIYMVADSYGKGSAGYNDAVAVAARTYPKNVPAVVNAARTKMEQGDVAGAIALLENSEVKENATVLNILGVAYAKDKQYDRAKDALERAAKGGSTDAQTNLQQLAGVVADL